MFATTRLQGTGTGSDYALATIECVASQGRLVRAGKHEKRNAGQPASGSGPAAGHVVP